MSLSLVLCVTDAVAEYEFNQAARQAFVEETLQEAFRSRRKLVSKNGDVTLFYGPTRCGLNGYQLRGMKFDSLRVVGCPDQEIVDLARFLTKEQSDG